MNIIQSIRTAFGMSSGIYTPEMLLAMKHSDRERVRAMTIELAQNAMQLTKKDIAFWRQAWQAAIHPENPQRRRLYEVYTDVDIDLHLSGCISQREGMVLQKAFKLADKNGKENREASEIFETEWFKDFIKLVLDSRYWGHSLMQFGDIVTVDGKRRFENVELVPRMHVIPEYGVITREAGDDPKKGFSYRDGKIANWCIEAGKPRDLGLLLKCSPPAISKKNMLAFWDGFGELFGMPIRIGKTISRDPAEIAKIEKMLDGMGAMPWGLFPEGTEIELKETTRGDAFNVYDQRVERCNSEISKGILSQTMTIDDGSSLSQSEVHLEVFKNVVEADADMVRDVVNNRLIPFMIMHGFPLEGHRFEWDDTVEYPPQQMREVEGMLLQNGYDIEPQYFIDKYNIAITGRREIINPALARDDDDFFV
jgi:phage gp29-like protein